MLGHHVRVDQHTCSFIANIWCMIFLWHFRRLLLRELEKLLQWIIQGVVEENLIIMGNMVKIPCQVVS